MKESYHKYNFATRADAPLTRLNQWVAWKWGPRRDNGKQSKVPISPHNGKNASATDARTWGSFSQACKANEKYGCAGVGFVFTEADPFAGVDLDNCVDAGEVAPWAMEIVEALNSYTEVSPSGTGLKVWIEATKPGDRCKTGDKEMYDSGKFFTFTGERFTGKGVEKRQEQLTELYRRLFPQNTATPRSYDARTGLGDFELLEKARESSTGREFKALYDRGNPTGEDHSKADNKLMMMLAFWCGKDAEQMERLFSGSALGQRDKWTRRADYRKRTIERACNNTSKVYDPQHGKPQQTTREGLHRRMTYALAVHQWTEKAGRASAAATDYFAYRAMLRTAYKANRTTVCMSERELSEAAGLGSRQTARDSLRRLEDKHSLLVKVARGNKEGAATYRLKTVDAKLDQTLIKNTGIDTSLTNNTCAYSKSGTVLRQTPCLRNSAPEMPDYDKNGRRIPKGKQAPVERLGKVCAWILDMVYAAQSAASLSFLCERTGIRKNDLKARYMNQLIVAGLVKRTEEGYMPTTNVEEVLEEELEVSGCNDAAKLQQERHDREREAYRTRQAHKLEESVEVEDFDFIEELEIVEDPIEWMPEPDVPLLTPLAVAVRDYLERHPSRATETPSWIANTLWAYDLYPGKPTRYEVTVALEDLQGELQAVA